MTAAVPLESHDLAFLMATAGISEHEARARLAATLEAVAASHHVYRCIERFSFALPRVSTHPLYATAIQPRFADPAFRVLELGCCFGTDARKMLADGLRPECLTVSDLHGAYWQMGAHTLFQSSPPPGVTAVFGDLAVPVSDTDLVTTAGLAGQFDAATDFLAQVHRCLRSGGRLIGTCVGTLAETGSEWGITPTKGMEGRRAVPRWLHSKQTLTAALENAGFAHVVVDVAGNRASEGNVRLVFSATRAD
ncbi:hypothetical protein BC831DRAFT_463927 [Entophlyctis helioformis]|nr:hypothetical protein BC831DRAFT_463927 [Entophlyctis helioformis]